MDKDAPGAPLDFIKAATELSAQCSWQDPKSPGNDIRAEYAVLEIEYGEIEGGIGNGS